MCEPKFKIGATLVRTKRGGTFDEGYVFKVLGVKCTNMPFAKAGDVCYMDDKGSWHGEHYVKPFITKDGQPPEETLESIDKKLEAVKNRYDYAETLREEAHRELSYLRTRRRKLNGPKVGDRYDDGTATYVVTSPIDAYGRVRVDKEIKARTDVAVSWLSGLTKVN